MWADVSHKIERAQERKRGFQEGGIEQMWRESGGGKDSQGGEAQEMKKNTMMKPLLYVII